MTRPYLVIVALVTAFAVRAFGDTPKAAPSTKTLSISLTDAVRSALAYHPEAVRQRAEAEIARIEVGRQRAQIFAPVLTAVGSHRREATYVEGDDGDGNAATTSVQARVAGKTPYGGIYSLNYLGASSENLDGTLGILSPYSQSVVSARFTQPLLRDGGAAANQGRVARADAASKQAHAQAQSQHEQLAFQVIVAYWTLVVQREQLKIREANVIEATNLGTLIDRRIKAGQAPRSDAVEADVTVANREQLVRQARLAVIDAERQLLAVTYLNRGGTFGFENELVPTERPSDAPKREEFSAVLASALSHRPEVARQTSQLAAARLDEAIASNQRRLRLDIYAEAGLFGLAGTNASGGMVPPGLDGGFGRALSNSTDTPFFEIGVQLEVPLGNADRAGAARQAELRAAEVVADDVRTLVALDVRAALQALDLATTRVEGAKSAEKLSILNVDAQRKRYEGGAATIFDTLRAQDDLARAKVEKLLAAVEREIAQSRLSAARGTLLVDLGVTAP